jgi:type I restriction enzyme S subunit
MKQGWEIKKLKEVLKIQNGYAFDAKLFTIEKGTPLIRIRDIKKGVKTVTNFNGKYDKKYEVNAGDFLIGMDGDFGCYEWKGVTALLNQRVCRLQEFSSTLYPRFLFYGINKYLKAIEEVTAFATVKHISSKQIENIEIPLPPLPEQQRIVAILDDAFAKIEKAKANAEQNLKNAKELFESYLQGVFENKFDDWEEKTLGEVASFRNGLNFAKNAKGEQIKIVGVRDFQNSFWVPTETLSNVNLDNKLNDFDTLRDGDIIAVRSNGNPQLIGRTLLARNISEKISHSGFTIRIRLNDHRIDPEYLCNYVKTTKTRKILVDGGNGVGIKSLNQGSLSELVITYPNKITEQQNIVKHLNKISQQINKLEAIYEQKINDLEELKKSVLQKAFSGELKYKKEQIA